MDKQELISLDVTKYIEEAVIDNLYGGEIIKGSALDKVIQSAMKKYGKYCAFKAWEVAYNPCWIEKYKEFEDWWNQFNQAK